MSLLKTHGRDSVKKQALDAFNRAFEDNHRALFGYFFGRTGSRETAEDLLQEAFFRAWRSIEQLLALPAPRRRYWLFAVARNLVIDHYRHEAAKATAIEASSRELAVRPPTSSEDVDIDSLLLDEAIRELPIDLRTVLALQLLGGLSSRQIGRIVEKPAGTVRYELSMARKQLAQALALDADATQHGTRPRIRGTT